MAVQTKNNRRGSKGKITAKQAMIEAANSNGVPLWVLVAVKLMETGSGTGTGAVSSAGANGPFQLMPGTAASLGVKDPNNFAESADGAARLLAAEHKKFGSWNAALEAYNGGPGSVGKGYSYNEADAKRTLHDFGLDKLAATAGPHMQTVGLGEDLFGDGAGGHIFENFVNPFHFQPFNGGKAEGLETIPGSGDHTLNPFEPFEQVAAAGVALISMLTDIHFWIRLGEAVGALILIYMGLHSLTGQGPTPGSVVSTAAATKGL